MSKLKIRDDGVIIIKRVRLSYEHVFEPWAKEESQTKKFSGQFLMPKDTHEAEIDELKGYIRKFMKDNLDKKLSPDRLCMRDGDDRDEDEFQGHWYISASEKKRPYVVDRDNAPLTVDDDKIYSGCWVNVCIKLWAQNNRYGKRVNANLVGVQFCEHDESFSGGSRPDVNELFDGVDDDDDF